MKKIQIYNDDCLKRLKKIKDQSIDLIFADPPYNLSGNKFLTVKSGKTVSCDKGEWDKIKDLEENGYERIGIDHLAKNTDELAQLKSEKMLTRGFIGYPGKTKNLLGMGPSGLSNLKNCYAQNTYGLPEYFKSVKNKLFPVFRGCLLDEDLIIRRDVINHILNYYQLQKN